MTQDMGASASRWLPVVGFEGFYEVSDFGCVRSLRYNPPKEICIGFDKDGYPIVNLYREGRRTVVGVHRVVCVAFNGPQPNALHKEVAHLDGDRSNCHATNLKWCSKVENHHHRRLHGTHPSGERHPSARLSWKAAAEIRASTGLRGDIAAKFGISKGTVTDIRRGRRWQEPPEGSEP